MKGNDKIVLLKTGCPRIDLKPVNCQPILNYLIMHLSIVQKVLYRYAVFALVFCLFYPAKSLAQPIFPVDEKATSETRMLLHNLWKLSEKKVLFGHQDDMAYGVGWTYEPDRSDVKSVTGSYPAVYGWELGRLELDSAKNLDGVPFEKMVGYIKEIYGKGGINTLSWHFNDPVTGETSWSKPKKSSVKEIIPGGSKHKAYVQYLDKLALFIGKLKGPKGEAIPIIFRPLHEHTGSWFWWGKDLCTPDEYTSLWKFTVNYLRKTKNIHSLLIAYSAADYKNEAEYLERYPGDAYADVIGFDAYMDKDAGYFLRDMHNRFSVLERISKSHKKLPALTETGYNKIPDANWWTKTLLPVITKYRTAYVLTWRNWKTEHFFAPYPGQASAADFVQFYKSPATLFQSDLKPSIYTKPL